MQTIYEFSHQINEFRKSKNYVHALEYFKINKVNFEKGVITSNQYLLSDMLTCLRHTNHFDAGFQFLHNYEIKINEQTPEVLITAYAWLLYDNFKFENNINSTNELDDFTLDMSDEDSIIEPNTVKSDLIKKIVEVIRILMTFDSVYSKSALELLFKIVLKVEKNKPSSNWAFVVSFCDSINPENLSTSCSTIQVTRKGILKDMELASARENWYAFLSKGLFELQNYERCFEVSKLAIESFETFHYSNDIWFARRIALCKKKMGNIDDAIKELETILRKKRDWFIRKELAEMYLEVGNEEKAFTNAMAGMSASGDLEYKVELIELLAGMLKKRDEPILAYNHYVLVSLIREEEKWRISHSLIEIINSFSDMKVYKLSDKKALISTLELYWKNESPQQKSNRFTVPITKITTLKQSGVIKKLLPPKDTGRDGFITKENGGEVYFFLHKENNQYSLLKEGNKVEFETEKSKNGKGDQAIKMRTI